jgi:hypothetical protein
MKDPAITSSEAVLLPVPGIASAATVLETAAFEEGIVSDPMGTVDETVDAWLTWFAVVGLAVPAAMAAVVDG